MDVVWEQSALDELAKLWNELDSDDRSLISDAVQRIDKLLEEKGSTAGESRENIWARILASSPLAVMYRITLVEREMTVKVVNVWPIYKLR